MAATRPPNLFASDAMLMTTSNDRVVVLIQVLGECVAQPRPRFRAIPRQNQRIIVYDPGQGRRLAWAAAVRAALIEVGVTRFPVFTTQLLPFKLKVTVTFHIMNLAKDINNMVKFLLDAMQGLIYSNDKVIYKIVAEKKQI